MKRFGTTTRIALALAMWSAVVLLTLRICGILDDGSDRTLKQRTRLCEAIAIHCSQLASLDQTNEIRVTLDALVSRNDEIRSAVCHREGGVTLTAYRPQATDEVRTAHDTAVANRIVVPVYDGDKVWGSIEVAFESPLGSGWASVWQLPSVKVTASALALNLLGFVWILRRCFLQVDPARAIPERVRSALNTMSELVLVLDDRRRIMLANDAFASRFHRTADSFQGETLDRLPWHPENEESDIETRMAALLAPNASPQQTSSIRMWIGNELCTFKANASQIRDADGIVRGTLLSLDDITALAQRTAELQQTMQELEASRSAVETQNEQLRFLATRDPLTACLNRRAFFEQFEQHWRQRQRYGHELACIMVDVDHFKSINDRFGHAVGDEVLQRVSEVLRSLARDTDHVCRYGGEEFCILLPHIGVEGAAIAAERYRKAIEELTFTQLSVTASLGCSGDPIDVPTMHALLEQADRALYEAKRSGRNRVVRSTDLMAKESESSLEEAVLDEARRLQSELHASQAAPTLTPFAESALAAVAAAKNDANA